MYTYHNDTQNENLIILKFNISCFSKKKTTKKTLWKSGVFQLCLRLSVVFVARRCCSSSGYYNIFYLFTQIYILLDTKYLAYQLTLFIHTYMPVTMF